jgi:hypothetical protein
MPRSSARFWRPLSKWRWCLTRGAEIEDQAIEVADLTRKGLTWQKNRLLASPIKPILALDAKTGEFHREPCFLGKGITVKRNSPTSQPNANA